MKLRLGLYPFSNLCHGRPGHRIPTQWVTGALSSEVKRSALEANLSFPSNAEVKNVWSYTSTPYTSSLRGAWLSKEHIIMAWYFVKHRDNFTYFTSVPHFKTGGSVLHDIMR
jgi:hypothetical protein